MMHGQKNIKLCLD